MCVEVSGASAADAERVLAAIDGSLDALHASRVECGPDASLVVSARVDVVTEEMHGAWLSRVTCDLRVFDQRLAEVTGETAFDVRESLESSARDAEALALREAGRLITVFLEPRLAER